MNTPELDKMMAVKPQSQAIGEFLDWLGQQGIELASRHHHTEECYDDDNRTLCGCRDGQLLPYYGGGIESLLARYFEIDLRKVDDERRAILRELVEEREKLNL